MHKPRSNIKILWSTRVSLSRICHRPKAKSPKF